jgi:hypothetical protein
MRLSMALLFLRTDESQRIAQRLLSKIYYGPSRRLRFWRENPEAEGIVLGLRRSRWDQDRYKWGRDNSMKGTFHLKQFRHYRPRLAYLQEQRRGDREDFQSYLPPATTIVSRGSLRFSGWYSV